MPGSNSVNRHVKFSWLHESNKLGAKWKVPLLESGTVVESPVARGDMTLLLSFIQSIANFRYYLCRSVSPPPQGENNWTGLDNLKRNARGLIKHFSIHLYELGHDSKGFRVPKRETDYLVPSCQPIVGGESQSYVIDIVNESPQPVYPYLFYFDPCSYEIQVRLHDAYIATHVFFQLWNQGKVLPGAQEAKDKKSNKLMIGFGDGDGHPIRFAPGETVFLKLFVSTESWGNVQLMEQTGVSELKLRAKKPVDPVVTDFADAFLFKLLFKLNSVYTISNFTRSSAIRIERVVDPTYKLMSRAILEPKRARSR